MKKIRWTMTDVIEGHWYEIDLYFHRWKWGVSLELFGCWCSYDRHQAPPPWVWHRDDYSPL